MVLRDDERRERANDDRDDYTFEENEHKSGNFWLSAFWVLLGFPFFLVVLPVVSTIPR